MPGQGEPGEGQPGQGQPGQGQQQLGTGLVPNAPQVTAQQIAGSEALAQASQALSQSQGQPSQGQPSQGQPSQGQPMPNNSPSTPMAGGASVDGKSTDPPNTPQTPELKPVTDSDSRTADSGHDADVKGVNFDGEPWFAKLPPSLQNAIRAKSRRRAPRGYEERLRRYFESVD